MIDTRGRRECGKRRLAMKHSNVGSREPSWNAAFDWCECHDRPGRAAGTLLHDRRWCVVTADVEPFALMVGTPARVVGYVCRCGQKLFG